MAEPLVCDLVKIERRFLRGDVLYLHGLDGTEIDLCIGGREKRLFEALGVAPGNVHGVVMVTLIAHAKGYAVSSFWKKGR